MRSFDENWILILKCKKCDKVLQVYPEDLRAEDHFYDTGVKYTELWFKCFLCGEKQIYGENDFIYDSKFHLNTRELVEEFQIQWEKINKDE